MFPVELPSLHGLRREIFNDDISPLDKLSRDLFSLFCPEVKAETQLAEIDVREICGAIGPRLVVLERGVRTQRIMGISRLYLDDRRAEVCKFPR